MQAARTPEEMPAEIPPDSGAPGVAPLEQAHYKLPPLFHGAISALIVFLAATISISVLHHRAAATYKEATYSNLIRIGEAAASIVDAETHQRLVSPEQQTSPEFEKVAVPLRNMLHAVHDLKYLYTAILRDDKVYFMVDPVAPGDHDGDGVDDQAKLLQRYDEAAPEMYVALREGRATVTREPYTDPWGTFISGYVPFRDAQGRQVGVVGADITAMTYREHLSRMREAAYWGLIPAILVSLGTGIGVTLVQRAALRHNAMREAAEAELQAHAIRLETANQHLLEARAAAEAANVAKSQFLANISHEVRTPINGIMGMANILLSSGLTEEQAEYAEIVCRSSDSLLGIVNDILDFSKLEADRVELEHIDFHLPTTIEDVVDILAPRAVQKGIELIYDLQEGTPTELQGDPGRFKQILMNFVSNAIKFTTQGEVLIEISAVEQTEEYTMLRVSVRDSGIGIPPESHDRIFQSFSQADASTTRKFGGTGLGLAISKRLAELMGGTVGFESEAGKGSTFWFTAKFSGRHSCPIPVGTGITEFRGKRILVVDDNSTNRRILEKLLDLWGCQHFSVATPEDALLIVSASSTNTRFDLAIVDMQLPGIAGDELGRRIKEDAMGRDVRLVMLTSAGRRGDVERIQQLGFDGYLVKPVKPQVLHDTLGLVFGRTAAAEGNPAQGMVTRHTVAESFEPVKRDAYVLLVEDNLVNQKVACKLLEKLVDRIDIAGDGAHAVQMMKRTEYDLVFMDCQMPVCDGFEATRMIRSETSGVRNRHVPIVAMTADAMAGDRENCLRAGMDDYIAKPVRVQELSRVLGLWLNKSITASQL